MLLTETTMATWLSPLFEPWHWFFSGLIIALIMGSMLLLGKTFGVSSTMRTLCAIGGAGKVASFFRFNWKDHVWNLVFVGGIVIGGFISNQFLGTAETVALSEDTISDLAAYGITHEGQGLIPSSLFSWEALGTGTGFLFTIIGGFLVGFGTRYAGGCTSGHAISGLTNLQLPSLIAVIGFFIGGLVMTHLLFPLIFS